MKKILRTLPFGVIFLALSLSSFGFQHKTRKGKSKVTSEKGYFVIESNLKTPKSSVVHFYNNDHVLIYKEKVEGIKLDPGKPRTARLLIKALNESILLSESAARSSKGQIVKNIFKL